MNRLQRCIALDDFSEGHSDYWTFGLLGSRTIGPSDYWDFGLLSIQTIGPTPDLQLSVQSVPITTKVVNSNPVRGEVSSIQLYVIKFVSDLRQVGGFLPVLWCPPPIKLTTTI